MCSYEKFSRNGTLNNNCELKILLGPIRFFVLFFEYNAHEEFGPFTI